MKKRNADALDTLLQQWGKRRASDDAHLRELEMRVLRNTRESLYSQASAATTDNRSWLQWPRIVGLAAMGAVAAGLVMMAYNRPFGDDITAIPQVAQTPSLVSPFSPEQMAARTLLYRELNDLFGDSLRWATVTDDELQFDFGTVPVRTEASPVALRTVVSKRSTDGREWIPVWQADIMLAPDEYVTLEKPGHPMPALGLWVHRLPDGAYVVHADIGNEGNSSSSQMLPFLPGGDAIQTVCLDSGGNQYRLSQSLAELSKGSG